MYDYIKTLNADLISYEKKLQSYRDTRQKIREEYVVARDKFLSFAGTDKCDTHEFYIAAANYLTLKQVLEMLPR